MKHTPQSVAAVRGRVTLKLWRSALALAMLGSASLGEAGLFVKTNNADALNLATSWTNNAVPGAADIARWDSTVSDVNFTTNTLGASLSLGGLQVLSPVGPIRILTNTAVTTLTLGTSGIDLAGASQDLTMSNNVTLLGGAVQTWSVPAGRTLTLGSAFTRSAGAALSFNDAGTINIAGGTAGAALFYSLFNGTDVGALDAAKNVSSVGTVLTYVQNTMGGQPGGQYCDVVNANTGTADDVYLNSTIYFPLVMRFNNPQPNRSYWYWNVRTGQNSLPTGPGTVLVTTNVGKCDVIIYGASHAFRWAQTGGSELIIDQENTGGTFYVNGFMSQKNALASNMLTKRGAGRAVFNTALVTTGPTRVLEGELMLNGGTVLASVTTVSRGATLSGLGIISGSATNLSGGTIWPGTNGFGVFTITNLTLNAGSALKFYGGTVPTTNTTALLNLPGGLTVNGAVSVSILSGATAVGQYPLIKWTNAIPDVTFANFALAGLPPHISANLSNNATAGTIDLVISSVNLPLNWATGSGVWNTTTSNWKDTLGATTTYQEFFGVGDRVLFGDVMSGASPITVTLNSTLSPSAVLVSNVSKTYTLAGNGSIGGAGSLTKSGAGTLTLATTNSFTGSVNLNGGTTLFSTLTNLGAGAINFGGGTLQFESGNVEDLSVRTVTFNAGGGTLNDGGNILTFANPIGNSGVGGLTKSGVGSLTLTGTNKFTGNTVVANGTLALAGNTFISNSAAIIVSSGATLDAASSGVGLTLAGSTVQTLAGAGTVNGTVVSSNGVITPGTNGIVGTLSFGSDLTVAGGTVVMDYSPTLAQRDLISVGGNLYLYGGTLQLNVTGTLANGVYKLIQYAGGLASGSGSAANLVLSGSTQSGKIFALSDSVNANEIDLIVSTQGGANLVWQGDGGNNFWDIETTPNFLNGATAVNFVQGDKPVFNDASANATVNLVSALQPASVTVTANNNNYVFNDATGSGAGKLTGAGGITKNGTSTLTIATANLNSGPTVINGGTVQVGNGGSFGDLGSGNITNKGALVFAQAGDHAVPGTISGTGSLTQSGSGAVTLAADNTYSGPTTITSGTLQVGTGGAAGNLGSGAITNDGTLIYNHTGTFIVGKINTGPNNGGAVTFAGAAAVTLTNGNTYINNTTINGGVVKLAVAEAIPSSATVANSTGWLVLNGGAAAAGVLDLNGFNQTANALSGTAGTVTGIITNSALTGTNTLTLGTAGTTYNGTIVDNTNGAKTALKVLGSSSLRLNGNNTYSGGTFVGDTATLTVGAGGTIGNGGQITLSNGTTFFMQNAGSTAVFPVNNLFIPPMAAANLGSGVAGNGFSGTIIGDATATNIISGATQVSFSPSSNKQLQPLLGTLVVPSGASLRFSGSTLANGGDFTSFVVDGSVNTKNGGTVSLGSLDGAGSINAGASGVVTYNIGLKNVDSTFSGGINGSLPGTNTAIVKSGTARLTLSGALAYSGATTVSNGVLALQTSLDTSSGINLVANTSQLDISSIGLTLGNAANQTLSGVGSVTGNLTVSSSYGCNLSAGATGTAGTLTLNGTVTLNNTTTNLVDFNTIATTGGGTNDLLQINGDLTLNNMVYVQPNFPKGGVAMGVPYTFIQYTGALTGDANNLALVLGSDYSRLSALFSTDTAHAITVTFTGATNLVWVGDTTNSWQVGTVTNWFDGTGSNEFFQFDQVAFNDTASNFVVSVTGTNIPGALTVNASSNYTFSGSGKISGAAALLKAGTGTLLLTNTGVNDYAGGTVISNGVLRLGVASALSANAVLQILPAGLLELAGTSPSVAGLSGAGAIDNVSTTSSTLTVGSSGSGVWSGTITNAGTGGVCLTLNDTNNLVITGVNRLNSATASTINNGTAALIITNNGVVTLGSAELWIGANTAVTGKVIVAGGTLVVSNNYLVIGRNNTNANGTLIVNSGLVQKAGANPIFVGSLGATGNLTVNGGQVLNNNALVVGENTGANATVNLNGGLVQATAVRTNGTAPASSVINFNGGILQATAASANYIQGVTANVQNGGLILDDGGFTLSLPQPLLAAGTGGLTKQGLGTVYLDATNTYTGTTLVSTGTVAGVGRLAGSVTVGPAGTIGAGDATLGKLTIGGALNVQGTASLRISKTGGVKTSGLLAVASAVTYGGTLAVTNVTSDGTPLVAGDTFTLFTAGSQSGAFASVVGTAGSGLGYAFTNGVLTVVPTVNPNPPVITFSVSGNTLSLAWPADHLGWTLQQQTNSLTTGLGTNWVDVAGSTSIISTNITTDATKPTVFYRLKL